MGKFNDIAVQGRLTTQRDKKRNKKVEFRTHSKKRGDTEKPDE
jgi:hypothetical protein